MEDPEGKGAERTVMKAYAAYNRDKKTRYESSSGGVFPALAEAVLKQQGVVFGVRFDGDFQAVYDCAQTMEEVRKFQGAKYVFPSTDGVYLQVKAYLEQGRYVLFTGLPCHTAGLLYYLRDTDQSTLFCADLVCHGTPERTAWNAWLKEEEQRRGSITGIRMRDKSRGWTDYRIAVTDWSGSEHREYASDHIYMRGFVGSLYLRKPCYRCRFRGMERSSDLTLGDYWGGGRMHPDLDDDGGLSLILCHTKKGKKLLESAAEKLIYAETDPEYAVTQNKALVCSPEEPVEREAVLRALEKGDGFRRATAAWIRRNTDGKIRWRIRRMRRLYKKKIRLLKNLYVL